MKKLKLFTAVGFSALTCCSILPMTSCGLKTTWSESKDKKVTFTPQSRTVTIDSNDEGVIVFEMDRPLVQEDFSEPVITLPGATLIEQIVEAPYVTLKYTFKKSEFSSGTQFKIALVCPNYRVIEDTEHFEIIY